MANLMNWFMSQQFVSGPKRNQCNSCWKIWQYYKNNNNSLKYTLE